MPPTSGRFGARDEQRRLGRRARVVRKLARGSLLSRLKRSRQPLKLVAVPRDHVHGDRQRGDALARRAASPSAARRLPLADLDFARDRRDGPAGRAAPGLLLAPRPRRRRVARERRAARRSGGRALAARPRRAGRRGLGARICGASASSSGPLMRPTSCRARQRLSLGPAQHARARRPAPRGDRRQGAAGTDAGDRLVRRGCRRPAGPGRRVARRARRSRARARAGLGAVRRRRADQPLAVRAGRCWSTASACCAPAIRRPSRPFPTASRRPRRPRSPRFMASPWATARCRAGRAATPANRRG